MSKRSQAFLQRNFIECHVSTLPLPIASSIGSHQSLADAVQRLVSENVGCLVVTEKGGALCGILSERDLIARAYAQQRNLSQSTVQSAMTSNPTTLPDYASVGRALYAMSSGHFRHIPILARSPERTLMLSVKNLVDLIYTKIAAPVLEAKTDVVVEQATLKEFFHHPVSSLKPDSPISVGQFATVAECLALMVKHHIGSVVICNPEGKVVGIFTERDFVQRVAATSIDPASTPVTAVMTPGPKNVLEGSSVALAFSLFSAGRYRHLPIVDATENLKGILSVKSFVQALARGIVDDLS